MMASEPSRLEGLGRAAVILAASVGVPVAGLVTGVGLPHGWRAALAVFAYELGLVVIGFLAAVGRDLRARWVVRTAEVVDGWLRRRASRFTAAYLRYVQAANRYVDLKGLTTQGEHTLEMKDVLISLALAARPVHEVARTPVGEVRGRADAVRAESIWYWLRMVRRRGVVLAVVGPPGCGKTTVLRHVAYTLARGGRDAWKREAPQRIPVLVNLREYRDFDATGFTLVDLLRRSLSSVGRPEPPSWIESNLRRGNFVVMLDGLDEIPEETTRATLTNWIEQQVAGQRGNLVVLTSRPYGYQDNPVAGAIVVEPQNLTEEQIAGFVRQWYLAISIRGYAEDNDSSRLAAADGAAKLLAALGETPALAELTVNPLLLTMIANVHHYRGALPGSRSELYQEICDVLLGKRHQARGVVLDMPGRQKKMVLRELAYAMMCDGTSQAPEATAVRWVEPALARATDTVTPQQFLRRVEETSGLLVEGERGMYTFAHRTFQEYLAAELIHEAGRVHELVAAIDSVWWRETIRLYAAISDATPIIDACLDRRTDPELLALAVQCAEESHDVAPRSRRAVEECLNPPDARHNRESRQLAARARLQLRASRDAVLGPGRFLSDPSITWLEYQYFLDSMAATGDVRIPDHWTEDVYPPGQDTAPAVGIRYEDASRFCQWLPTVVEANLPYRLPHDDELTSLPATGHVYWTGTQSAGSRDSRYFPLLRDWEEELRQDPYPSMIWPKTVLSAQRTADLGWLRQPAGHGADLDSGARERIAELLGGLDDGTEALFDRCWSRATGFDVGQMSRDIYLTQHLVVDFLTHSVPARVDLRVDLLRVAEELAGARATVFDRASYADRLTEPAVEARRRARLFCLDAAAICVELHIFHGGGRSLPPPGQIPRPTRKDPNPSLLPTVATSVLAHAFVALYVDLSILESRLRGRVAPAEAIAYVRQAAKPEQPDYEETYRDFAERHGHRIWGAVKPFADRVAAALALLLLSPLLLFIVVAIRLDSPGPALFRQVRVGRLGREFVMYKFRTMVVDAERRREELTGLNEANGSLFKMRSDPRVTRFGRFLRRYSLDELPQVLNILTGSMSWVGPRPPLPQEVAQYDERILRRLVVRPGITGLWQVSGRSDLSWEQSIRLDFQYIENSSLLLDLRILARTVGAVIRGVGAY